MTVARALLLCLLVSGCTAEVAPPDGSGSDGGALDAAAPRDAEPGGDAGTPEVDAGPPPEDRAPCAMDRCWETAIASPRCVTRTIAEDFSSGRYDAHAWATMLWAGTPTRARLERTAGTWQPAIVLIASDGTVLYDGAVGLVRSGLVVAPGPDGRSGSTSEVSLTSDADLAVTVYATSWAAVDSGFATGPPADARYELVLESDCGAPAGPCVVNGNPVDDPACAWIHYVGREVVPRLEGTRDEALDAAAAVTWWALKEGVLSLSNPIVYSNCNFPAGDMRIGPLETCADGRAWQVGMSAVQVPGRTLDALEASAATLFGELTSDEVLERTAREAAVDEATRAAIVGATGALRISWLLRTSAIGFTFQAPTVTAECVVDTRAWCYGTGWRETTLYAPDRASALGAIDDIRAILDADAP